MGLILLEALLALVVLALIVWWTMFSGRKRGELTPPDKDSDPPAPWAQGGIRELSSYMARSCWPIPWRRR